MLIENTYKSLRGRNVFRIEALSDGVFAISVTLLIMSLEVPNTYEELKSIMWQFLPFSVTVSIVFLIWWQQSNFFRLYGIADSKIKLLNLILLVVVLFYVFPLKFLFSIIFYSVIGADFLRLYSISLDYSISKTDFPGLIVFFRLAKHIHIGVAVAVEEGLMVPVMEFSDLQSLTQIGQNLKTLPGKREIKKSYN